MKVKRLSIVFFLLVTIGCSGKVTKEEIDVCEKICKSNGGLNNIYVDSPTHDDCHCNNGVSITMYDRVIKSNKSKD